MIIDINGIGNPIRDLKIPYEINLDIKSILILRMVKAGLKASHAVKASKSSMPAPSGSTYTAAGDASTPPNDSDDDEFGDCAGVGVDNSSFDSRVDRCFLISDIGDVRQVNVGSVTKQVYNVMLINPLGELIFGGVLATPAAV